MPAPPVERPEWRRHQEAEHDPRDAGEYGGNDDADGGPAIHTAQFTMQNSQSSEFGIPHCALLLVLVRRRLIHPVDHENRYLPVGELELQSELALDCNPEGWLR